MKTHKLTLIGLFTAILCILGPIAIILPFSPVPLSLGTLGVLLACLLLGTKNGLFCTILYLILGFVGLPVFTGFTGGVGKLFGPTGGYLLGYLFLAAVGGLLAERWRKHLLLQALGLFIGMCCCYLLGTLWLMFQADVKIQIALWVGVIPYVPFDVFKIGGAVLLNQTVRKRKMTVSIIIH